MISDEQLQKFRDIYRKNFGEDISPEEALPKAIQLVRLMQIIYKPITEDELAMVIKRRRELGIG